MTDPQVHIQLDQPQPRTRVVTVAGDIDLDTVTEFDAALRGAVTSPGGEGGCVTVDLHAVTFMGVCGVNALFAARELAAAGGATLVTVTAPESATARICDLIGWIHDPSAGQWSETSTDAGDARMTSPAGSPTEDSPTPAGFGPPPVTTVQGRRTDPDRRESRLAPFVAWLATQEIDEDTRRQHREGVEAFLDWVGTDHGLHRSRRRRYEQHVETSDPARLAAARAGIDRYVEHRAVVAATLPIDHH